MNMVFWGKGLYC